MSATVVALRTPYTDAKRYLGAAPYDTPNNRDRGSAAFAADCVRRHGCEKFHQAVARTTAHIGGDKS